MGRRGTSAPEVLDATPGPRGPAFRRAGRGRSPGRRRHRRLRGLCVAALLAAYLVAVYQPFRLEPPWIRNTVEVSESGALRFDGTAMARAKGSPAWVGPAVADGELLVDVEARTDDPDQDGPARLVTLSAGWRSADLALGQLGDDLVVRLRRPGANRLGLPALVAEDVFAGGGWRAVTVRVAAGRVAVDVDGEVVAAERVGRDPLRSWDGGMGLTLGNEVDGSRGWSGELRRVTVSAGGTTVDHLSPGAYRVPAGWVSKPLTQIFVEPTDVVLNVLGFVPFGLLFPLVRPGRPLFLRALAASFLLSAAMELGQLAVVSRDPSLLDLALNTAGGALGGLLAVAVTRRRRRSVR